jgi:transcriptional regulator with XRE-family HTH domain
MNLKYRSIFVAKTTNMFNILNTSRANHIMKNIGGTIKALRQEKQMTLPALAEKSGLSKGLISKIENSPDANPSLDTLHNIATALDVTLADLLEKEKVQVKRFTPNKPPGWLAPLIDGLTKDGKTPNEDYIQALYVLQHRKANSDLKPEQWRWLYDSIELSFKT